MLQAQAVEHRPDPRQLFERMRLATMLYSYSGSLTYEHDGQLSSYALASRIDAQQRTQNITALNGPERSFVQQLNPCELGTLEQLRSRIAEETEALGQYYNFQARGDFRIASRDAQELLVMPVDQYRYGYNFAVDLETGLMLHSMTMDSTRKILERFQFIQIDQPPSADDFQALVANCPENGATTAESDPLPWRLGWLPAGFEQIFSRSREGRSELVASDGLATLSIFIAPVDQVRFPPVSDTTGATSLMLNHFEVFGDLFSLTLVGEVPLVTLQRIASELQYQE